MSEHLEKKYSKKYNDYNKNEKKEINQSWDFTTFPKYLFPIEKRHFIKNFNNLYFQKFKEDKKYNICHFSDKNFQENVGNNKNTYRNIPNLIYYTPIRSRKVNEKIFLSTNNSYNKNRYSLNNFSTQMNRTKGRNLIISNILNSSKDLSNKYMGLTESNYGNDESKSKIKNLKTQFLSYQKNNLSNFRYGKDNDPYRVFQNSVFKKFAPLYNNIPLTNNQ